MSNATDQFNRDTYAQLAKISYKDPDPSKQVTVNGATYNIIDTASTSTGFQATAYQRDDQVFIAYRGTEIKLFNPGETGRDVIGADYGMVKNQLNIQTPDADAFTQRVLDNVKKQHPDWNLAEHVHLAGHSLGATHAEREAAKHGLGGAGYNGYGAVGLGYHVPEGQPKNAPAFDNYVRATDVVSAATRHYGNVHIFATEKDIADLQTGRYIDAPNPAHPANPVLTGDLGAHFVSNFAPDPGKGESIMTAANEARYRQYQPAIDHYRSDVMTSRIDLHDVLNPSRDPAQAARLEAQVCDALEVARYRLAVGAVERATTRPFERRLEEVSQTAHASGQSIHVVTEGVVRGTQAAGQSIQSGAEQFSRNAHAAGQTLQHSANAVSREAVALPNPLLGAGVSLGAMGTGYVMRAEADGLARGSDLAGQLANAAAAKAEQQIHAAGERTHTALNAVSARAHGASQSIHDAAQRLASTRTDDAVVDKVAEVKHGAQAVHQRVEQTLEHTWDAASHAVSRGVENVKQSAGRAYDTLTHSGHGSDHDVPSAATQTHSPSSPLQPQSQAITPTDPRHSDNPDHALYNTLKERIPEAGESRLVQFTAACHTSKINDQNLNHVFLNEQAGLVGFTSGGLMPTVASVDIKEPPPQAAQSIQHVQQYDQQQAQMMGQIQAQMAQTHAQGQQGPMLGGR